MSTLTQDPPSQEESQSLQPAGGMQEPPVQIVIEMPPLQPGVTEEALATIRQVTAKMAKGSKLQHLLDSSEINRLRDIAELHIPRTVREAVDVIDILGLTQTHFRKAVKFMNVLNAGDMRNVIMREIIASKMVQRGICLKVLFECMEDLDIESPAIVTDQHRLLRSLPQTSIKGRKFNLPMNRLYWLDGDIPLYTVDGRIVPGHPPLHGDLAAPPPDPNPEGHALDVVEPADEEEQERTEEFTVREFEDSEYCRLLHALADKKMASYLKQLMDQNLKDRVWKERVAPIFNDRRFQPKPVRSLSGGVSKNDIADLRPTFVTERDGDTLQNKFAEFKSLYRAAVRSYVQFGNDDTETFSDFCQGRQYVMYAFCLLENYPKLEPITLRNPTTDKQTSEATKVVPQKRAAPIEEIDLEEDVPSSPTPKRVKAAMLQGPERAELSKIIKGGKPGEVVADHGMAGITAVPVEGLTKSEVVQQVERAEREKENMEHLMASRMVEGNTEKQGPSLVISQPRSAALEEIEGYARERAIIETRNARVNYTTSLLVAIKEANHAIEHMKKDNEERRLFVDLASLTHEYKKVGTVYRGRIEGKREAETEDI